MKHTETTRELLRQNKGALKQLHDIGGYNFNKPFTLSHIVGNFTIKKALSDILPYYNNPFINIIIRNEDDFFTIRHKYHIITVSTDGSYEISIKTPHYKKASFETFYTFWRKADFEKMRKKQTCEAFIFAQELEHTHRTPKKAIDKSKRYIYQPSPYEKAGDGNGNTYISRITLKETDGTGEVLEYQTEGRYITAYDKERRATNANDIIDKSGYFIREHREDLRRRAAQIRAEKQKNIFTSCDFSAELAKTRAEAEKAKREVIEALKNANTSEQIGKVAKAMRWELEYIYNDVERHEEKTIKKEYASVEKYENAKNNITNKINKMLEDLKK